MKIEIKHRGTREVLFAHDAPDNCMKVTLHLAIASGADLRWADLSGANLSEANLRWADLSWANLSRANLSRADLSWANLSEANLRGANLSWANLSGANLSEADLSWANLRGANLRGANLSEANLSEANLDFSCWPFCCGSFGAKADKRLVSQIAKHLALLDVSTCDADVQAAMRAFRQTPMASWFDDFRSDLQATPKE